MYGFRQMQDGSAYGWNSINDRYDKEGQECSPSGPVALGRYRTFAMLSSSSSAVRGKHPSLESEAKCMKYEEDRTSIASPGFGFRISDR